MNLTRDCKFFHSKNITCHLIVNYDQPQCLFEHRNDISQLTEEETIKARMYPSFCLKTHNATTTADNCHKAAPEASTTKSIPSITNAACEARKHHYSPTRLMKLFSFCLK